MTAFDNILKRLAGKELILPILENQMRADEWPESYTITVDSRPYYGRGDGYFHPSTHPLLHPRQLYYMFHPDTRDQIVDEPFSIQREMTLAGGSAMHAVLQTQLQMAKLCGPEDIEVEFINERHHVRGRADFVAHHPTEGPILADIKTRTGYRFDQTVEPLPEWEAQISLGCDALSARYNTDFTYGIVVLLEMGYPFRMKEIRVERNDELLAQIYAKFDYVRQCIADNTPPQYCCAPDSAEMKSCRARHVCWLKEMRK